MQLLIEDLDACEKELAFCTSLVKKFPGKYPLVTRLLQASTARVMDNERECVHAFFDIDSPPVTREYILQGFEQQGNSEMECLVPQRMYAKLSDEDFELVEVHTRDNLAGNVPYSSEKSV